MRQRLLAAEFKEQRCHLGLLVLDYPQKATKGTSALDCNDPTAIRVSTSRKT